MMKWHQAAEAVPAAGEGAVVVEAAAGAEVAEPETAGEAEFLPEAHAETPEQAKAPEQTEEGAGEVPGSSRLAAVRTLEAARAMVEGAGLMLFAPQPAMQGVSAPTLVEATLGEPKESVTVAEGETARSLLARMVTEGSAVPLNLLGAQGTTGETPDFVASAAVFGYVFTLRGDKNWKQMPEATGTHKVSPLAVNTYGLLVENGPQSVGTLVTELGKGLTEAAVLRALGELWQQLRVIPVAQLNGKATMWEPITSRLQKQVKAGANAGVPTALSALISLYLGQAILATEDEIETFLSPLSPRSRVRDVVHALMAAQQLETMTVAGRHHLYVAGELPEFAPTEQSTGAHEAVERGPRMAEDGSRIRRMVRSTDPAKGGWSKADRAKPFRAGARPGGDRPERKGAGGARKSFGDRGGFGSKSRLGAGARPGAARFDRPWEERPARRPAAGDEAGMPGRGERALPAGEGGGARRPASGFAGGGDRPVFRRGGERPAFGRGPEGFAGREGAGGARGERPPHLARDRGGSGTRAIGAERGRPGPSPRQRVARAQRRGSESRFGRGRIVALMQRTADRAHGFGEMLARARQGGRSGRSFGVSLRPRGLFGRSASRVGERNVRGANGLPAWIEPGRVRGRGLGRALDLVRALDLGRTELFQPGPGGLATLGERRGDPHAETSAGRGGMRIRRGRAVRRADMPRRGVARGEAPDRARNPVLLAPGRRVLGPRALGPRALGRRVLGRRVGLRERRLMERMQGRSRSSREVTSRGVRGRQHARSGVRRMQV